MRSGLATPFWRALIVVRVATMGVAAYSIVRYSSQFAHPALGLFALAVMVGWTVFTTAAYAVDRGRIWPVVVADLVVSIGLLLASGYVDTAARIDQGAATLPGIWVIGPVVACAILGGPWAGAGAGVVIGIAGVTVRGWPESHTVANAMMAVLVGGGVGMASMLVGRAEVAMKAAAEQAAASAERERLARTIHDGVLQVLTLTQRRAPLLGPDGVELGRLAGEQEASLRALISLDRGVQANGSVDLRGLMTARAGTGITVSAPGHPVELPAVVARELVAAAGAALDNVAAHAGPGARAWILIEDEGAAVVVTVRDDGHGIPAGRLAEAEREHRFGMARSIRGRLADLGGSVQVTSAVGEGTEVELRVAR